MHSLSFNVISFPSFWQSINNLWPVYFICISKMQFYFKIFPRLYTFIIIVQLTNKVQVFVRKKRKMHGLNVNQNLSYTIIYATILKCFLFRQYVRKSFYLAQDLLYEKWTPSNFRVSLLRLTHFMPPSATWTPLRKQKKLQFHILSY